MAPGKELWALEGGGVQVIKRSAPRPAQTLLCGECLTRGLAAAPTRDRPPSLRRDLCVTPRGGRGELSSLEDSW